MLKLCKNHSKSFKVPFGGGTRKKERKKEKTEWFFFSLLRPLPPSLSPLLSFLYSCLFLPASIIIRYHSIPFHSVPPHHHHHLPPRSYFDSFPPFQPLSLSLSLSFSYSLHFLLLLSIKLWQPTKTKRITTQGIGIWLL